MLDPDEQLSLIDENIRLCEACPESGLGVNKVAGKMTGWGEAGGVVFIGLNPSYNRQDVKGEYYEKIWQCGKYRFFLDLVDKMNVERVNVYYTNLAKCSTPDNKLNDSMKLSCTKTHLTAEILAVKPKLIVALGREVFEWLTKTMKTQKFLASTMMISHPSYIHRFSKFGRMEQQLDIVFNQMAKEESKNVD